MHTVNHVCYAYEVVNHFAVKPGTLPPSLLIHDAVNIIVGSVAVDDRMKLSATDDFFFQIIPYINSSVPIEINCGDHSFFRPLLPVTAKHFASEEVDR